LRSLNQGRILLRLLEELGYSSGDQASSETRIVILTLAAMLRTSSEEIFLSKVQEICALRYDAQLVQVFVRKVNGIRHEESIFISSGPPFLLATALLATLAFLAAVGCGRNSQSENPKGDNKPQAASPTEVTAITIEPKTIPVTCEAVGQTEGSREVEVRARVGGILLQHHYSEGAFVKQGTLLFKSTRRPIRLR
jgi:hypothetical protein